MAVTRAQKQFVARFMEQDFRNATEAYLKAYPKASYDTARVEASRLLTKPCIKEYMSAVISEALEREKLPLEKRLFDYWVKRAFYDITGIIDLNGNLRITEEELRERGLDVCIDSVNKKINARGETTITYKFADKDAAAEMLQKYIQMIHEKIELNIKDDSRLVDLKNLLLEKAGQSPEERDRIIAELDTLTGNEE
jgi:phage terminase small subunit